MYESWRTYVVEAREVDLLCGAGRVAALECPRHSIHSRSRSTPREGLAKSKKLPPYGESFSLLVELTETNSNNYRAILDFRRKHRSKTGFIRDVVRLVKEAIALSLEESDEYDDLYDE